MRKVEVTFPNIDGQPITQIHYFNLTETDLADVMAKDPEFLKPSRLKELVSRSESATGEAKSQIQAEMAAFIKAVIVHSHGTRVDDEFFHIPEETLKFTRGLACNAVIQKVLEDEGNLLDFFMNVLPESMRETFQKATKEE